jgi:hypothetical protein
MGNEPDDPDREAILLRRQRWIALAVAGVAAATTACACACLSPPLPVDGGAPHDAGTDADRDTGTP